MNAHKLNSDGNGCLSCFDRMRKASVMPNSHTISTLFSGLSSGLGGNRASGARKIVELSRELVNDDTLDHHVASAVLRAYGDVGTVSEVDSFWQRCVQRLGHTSQGWPGSSFKFLSDLSQKIGSHGQWPRIGQLVAASPPPPSHHPHGSVTSRSAPEARGGAASGGRAHAPKLCKYYENGRCIKGSSCPFTH
jgi:hypothetical protein